MKYDCYTCGHNVYRLKDTTVKLPNGEFYLPTARHIFDDYRYSVDHEIKRPELPNETSGNGSSEGGEIDQTKGRSALSVTY